MGFCPFDAVVQTVEAVLEWVAQAEVYLDETES